MTPIDLMKVIDHAVSVLKNFKYLYVVIILEPTFYDESKTARIISSPHLSTKSARFLLIFVSCISLSCVLSFLGRRTPHS